MFNQTIATYAQEVGVNPDSGQPYRLTGYEYLTEPLNSLSPRMVLQKAAQVGATVMAMMRVMWFLEHRQKSAMYLFPTHRTADRFRRGRFSVMVQRSPKFQAMVKATGAPGHLRVGVAQFYCHGARSRAELMSVPVAYLTLDERDELYKAAGLEGTPWSAVDLARQRLAGQPDSWELSLSTPTIPGYGIAAEFARSDQRTFIVQCPRCYDHTDITWPGGVLGVDGPPYRAKFCCPQCRAPWSNDERRNVIKAGSWQSQVHDEQTHGYHMSQLFSPVAKAERLVAQWQEAEGDPSALQVFHNSVLGLPYLAEGARLGTACIEESIARSNGATMATSAAMSVAGIDVGPQFLHVVIAMPVGKMCRIVWAGMALNWAELERLLGDYGVRSYVIDAQPETHEARRLIHRRAGGWMCYYRLGIGSQHHQDTAQQVLRVPRSETLDALYHMWNSGRVIAPVNLPSEFVEQLRSPVRVVRLDRRGVPRVDYLEAGGADHYAHAMNYCVLALGCVGSAPRMEIV
ncbi:MAG TPA: phage terminase large subunit family protein [Gemmatales bacterium]|nr:phage terminase large subunit family protein [Gemmatales bacterium]